MVKKFEHGVALLAEGVDRNVMPCGWDRVALVALLAEGVDRNKDGNRQNLDPDKSPSSRRAWIEIVDFVVKESHHGGRPPRGGRG